MKAKNIITSVLFVGWLAVFAVLSLVLKDQDHSVSERRKLEQFETYSEKHEREEKKGKDYTLTEYFSWLEDYFLDQFPSRDNFRTLTAVSRFYVLNQSDSNGYYIADGSACKVDPELHTDALASSVESVNSLYDRYFASNTDVYYSVIPDKNYFYAENSGHLHYDYDELLEIYSSGLNESIEYIDIFPLLEGSDYYITDPHWNQKDILPVARHLLNSMGVSESDIDYTETELKNFNGTYVGQLSLPLPEESVTLLTNNVIDGCIVTDYETGKTRAVYEPDDYKNTDPYDIFLGGAKSLLRIENPSQTNGRQLVIFRDSFGSSLVPLLIDGYSEIIVADTRYIYPSMITDFVEFKDDCDVLFIYSTSVINTRGTFNIDK